MTLKSFYPDFFEDFSVKEVGLKLNPKDKMRVEKRLRILEQRAPAFSKISLEYKKSKRKISIKLSISGGKHHFSSQVLGRDPYQMYLQAEKEIDRQLLGWKKSRFMENSLKVPVLENQPQLTGGFLS